MSKEERILDMGRDTSVVFAGKAKSPANIEMYGQTADLFASEIRKKLLARQEAYSLLDVGSFQGELLSELLKKLPGYNMEATAVDANTVALRSNRAAKKVVVATAESLPFADKSFDIAIMRYVLQWNTEDVQKRILSELMRVVKGFILIEHVGCDPEEAKVWRDRLDVLFTGKDVPKLKRTNYLFSSRDEVEQWMKELNAHFERVRDRSLNDGADTYIERYALTTEEAQKTRELFGDRNYFQQTDWVVFPSSSPLRFQ